LNAQYNNNNPSELPTSFNSLVFKESFVNRSNTDINNFITHSSLFGVKYDNSQNIIQGWYNYPSPFNLPEIYSADGFSTLGPLASDAPQVASINFKTIEFDYIIDIIICLYTISDSINFTFYGIPDNKEIILNGPQFKHLDNIRFIVHSTSIELYVNNNNKYELKDKYVSLKLTNSLNIFFYQDGYSRTGISVFNVYRYYFGQKIIDNTLVNNVAKAVTYSTYDISSEYLDNAIVLYNKNNYIAVNNDFDNYTTLYNLPNKIIFKDYFTATENRPLETAIDGLDQDNNKLPQYRQIMDEIYGTIRDNSDNIIRGWSPINDINNKGLSQGFATERPYYHSRLLYNSSLRKNYIGNDFPQNFTTIADYINDTPNFILEITINLISFYSQNGPSTIEFYRIAAPPVIFNPPRDNNYESTNLKLRIVHLNKYILVLKYNSELNNYITFENIIYPGVTKFLGKIRFIFNGPGEITDFTVYSYPAFKPFSPAFTINSVNNNIGYTLGNFGIGVSNPEYQLDVASSNLVDTSQSYYYGPDGPSQNETPKKYIARIQGGLLSTYFGSVSDTRIKKDIQDLNDGDALQELRLIKPTTYKYKDWINRGDKLVIGFIAQQIRDVCPIAVNTVTDYIPNIYKNIIPDEIIVDKTYTKLIFNNLEFKSDIPSNSMIRIIDKQNNIHQGVSNWEGNSLNILIKYIINKDYLNEVFIYGVEVEDFLTLNKDYLFTINFAATQELDKIIKSQQSLIEKLREDLEKLTERVAILENQRT
jgi:hypothetical protein